MKTIGFPIPKKENEKRRALTESSLKKLKHPNKVYVEKGYGDVLGLSDDFFKKKNFNIVDRLHVFEQDIICNPKAGSVDEFDKINENQIIFGWIHAVQGRKITDFFIENKLTGFAWEDMFYNGRHLFWENNVIAGEAALIHALTLWGRCDRNIKIAVIGRGNVAQGIIRISEKLGFHVSIFSRQMEKLLRETLKEYDIVANAVLWDVSRTDHLLYTDDLKKMKPNSLILDVSCDEAMGIQSSKPTTFDEPFYYVDSIMHYVVDHTPSLFYKTASNSISNIIVPYIDRLITEDFNDILKACNIFYKGEISDQRIIDFQNRNI